jgi:hypothetical protein
MGEVLNGKKCRKVMGSGVKCGWVKFQMVRSEVWTSVVE